MDCFCQVVKTILSIWDPVSQQISYFEDLSNNMETLKSETKELEFKHNEIQAAINHEISVGKTRIPLVDKWLTDVRNIETEVDSMKLEFALRRMCSNSCCTDHWFRYELGKRIVKKIEEVKQVKEKGDHFTKVAESPRLVLVRQTSLPRGQQDTFKETVDKILQCLQDEKNGIIGVYGMGGIGKTTLMKAINNRFIGTNDFNAVIWVTVSKDLNLGLIQEQIGKKLDIRFDNSEDTTVKRYWLFTRLKNLRYLLILDDLWEAFSLDQVGIPMPDEQNRCKIVITTRSLAVCNEMQAVESIKAMALNWKEAWTLFHETCGDVVLSSEIRPIAEKVVAECSGLPLAIKTVGGSLRHKDRKKVWEDALRALKGSSPEVPGLERKVFLQLKHSYDSLKEDEIKLCFLYCSLFPEDYNIGMDELVRYWVMEERFIKNVNNLEEASNKGHAILERIKEACLLEEAPDLYIRGERVGSARVRMHDLLRDLAIWITSPASLSSITGPKFLVQAGEGLVQLPEENMWRGMERISLMRNQIQDLRITPDCPNLVSLLLNLNYQLHTIHGSFFELMPKLQMLDLSYAGIKSLPASLSLLVNLRALIVNGCLNLVEVPPLENLKELRHLDLSASGLKKFPQGIASLVKLKQLDLSCSYLRSIPCKMIYKLPCLEDLSMLEQKHVDGATFSEAVTMTCLTCLSIRVSNPNGFIANGMFLLWFSGLKRFNVHFIFKGESKLDKWYPISSKHIRIDQCDRFPYGIMGLIKHAFSLCFAQCKGAKILSQLVGDSKSLRDLIVNGFSGVECIINWREVGDEALQFLQNLYLHSLPDLEKIFDGGAHMPKTRLLNLRYIEVYYCCKLRCLFSPSMVEHLHRLEVLHVQGCSEMEEIIEGDMLPLNSFPRLRILYLEFLSNLTSIFSPPFIFLSLEDIKVTDCPILKKLPFLCSSIHQIRGEIEAEREWWEGLDWEDDHSKSLYSTIYNEYKYPYHYTSDEEEQQGFGYQQLVLGVPGSMLRALASALANANPEQQRTMLGESLYPLVNQLEHGMAPKVTGMLLELDQTEVLRLLESPNALKARVAEAMELLRNAAQRQRTMLGESLYQLVDQLEHDKAAKVTGMLLEMHQTEVLHLLESPNALKAKVAEAMEVLRNAAQQQQQQQ